MLTTTISTTSRNEQQQQQQQQQQQHLVYIARRISDIIMHTADVRSVMNSPLFQPLVTGI
jgi:hypothetical protein